MVYSLSHLEILVILLMSRNCGWTYWHKFVFSASSTWRCHFVIIEVKSWLFIVVLVDIESAELFRSSVSLILAIGGRTNRVMYLIKLVIGISNIVTRNRIILFLLSLSRVIGLMLLLCGSTKRSEILTILKAVPCQIPLFALDWWLHYFWQ